MATFPLALRPFSQTQFDLLAEQIDLQKCVLVLGPWASAGPSGQPVRSLLAHSLAAELTENVPDSSNLAMVATAFQRQNSGGKLILERTAANFLRQQNEPGELLKQVVQLPFRIILTTAQDGLLQKAFSETGRPFAAGHYRINQKQADEFDETSRLPFIYQLFGKVLERGSDSLILTQRDQLDYLDSVQGVGNETRLPSALRNAMQDSKCFLFLGFDYENWYLKVLLHVLKFAEKAELVFGLPENRGENGLAAATGLFFSSQFKFSFFEEDAVKLLVRLREKMAENTAENPPKTMAKTRRLLFLNAQKDAGFVAELDRSLSNLKKKFGLESASIHDFEGGDLHENQSASVDEAALLLPIISADFVADDWLSGDLSRRALGRHGSSGVRMVAIFAREIHGGTDFFRGKTAILPADDIPVSDMNQEKAFAKIAVELEKILAAIQVRG